MLVLLLPPYLQPPALAGASRHAAPCPGGVWKKNGNQYRAAPGRGALKMYGALQRLRDAHLRVLQVRLAVGVEDGGSSFSVFSISFLSCAGASLPGSRSAWRRRVLSSPGWARSIRRSISSRCRLRRRLQIIGLRAVYLPFGFASSSLKIAVVIVSISSGIVTASSSRSDSASLS